MFPRLPSSRTVPAAFLLGALLLPLAVSSAEAIPLYAARTKFSCVTCHFDPNGGGPRKDIGFLFARNRHSMDPDTDPEWLSLMALTNNLGDVFYFGTNTRLLYLYDDPEAYGDQEPDETSTFFLMQGAFYATLRPHKNLVVSYRFDYNEFSGARTRDLWGMIDNLPNDLYVRAGQFRIPFGLRQEDHTIATRTGFLNASSGSSGGILPYDSRTVESGFEVGMVPSKYYVQASLTNGASAFVNDAQTVAGKVGVMPGPFNIAASGYHSYRTSSRERATLWGAYALYGWRALSVIGEVVQGEDQDSDGAITRKIATELEVGYQFTRWFTATARYDYIDSNLDEDGFAAERFGGEAVFTAVPFADIRLAYRRIKPEMSGDENQIAGQFHFYY